MLDRLQEWRESSGAPPELVEFYGRLLDIQRKAEQEADASPLNVNAIRDRLNTGLPALKLDELQLDWSLAQRTFIELFALFSEYPELFGELDGSLGEVTPSGLKKVADEWLGGERTLLAQPATGVGQQLLEYIIQAALRPLMLSYSRLVSGHVDRELWRRNYCPVCGGSPDFAYLEKERGARWLVCSRCDTEWLFQRLECPWCGNQDQKTLGYFTDDEALYRLYVCERCKNYIKAIDLRRTEEQFVASLERLFTLSIDAQAQDYGFGARPEVREG